MVGCLVPHSLFDCLICGTDRTNDRFFKWWTKKAKRCLSPPSDFILRNHIREKINNQYHVTQTLLYTWGAFLLATALFTRHKLTQVRPDFVHMDKYQNHVQTQNWGEPRLGPVHTNTDSFESVYFLIRLGLPSTLTRGSDPPNPYKFGNALESG